MAIETMEDLMLEELREIHSAERQALRAYPRLRNMVETESLREAVEHHVEQTREQVERLNRIFEMMEARTRGRTCQAMQSLIEEAQEHADADLAPELMEVMLVADLQKIEHFEIAAYGSARAHAEALGMEEAVSLLEASLNEEKETDEILNRIATEEINPQAVAEDFEAEGEGDEGEDEEEKEKAGEAASSGERKQRAPVRGRSGQRGQEKGESGPDDLKSREYRDARGNVHHQPGPAPRWETAKSSVRPWAYVRRTFQKTGLPCSIPVRFA